MQYVSGTIFDLEKRKHQLAITKAILDEFEAEYEGYENVPLNIKVRTDKEILKKNIIYINHQEAIEINWQSGVIADIDFSNVESLSFSSESFISGSLDQSGNNNDAYQSNFDFQPTYVANVINGLGVARFADDQLIISDESDESRFNGEGLGIYMVVKLNQINDLVGFILRGNSWRILNVDSDSLRAQVWRSSFQTVSATSMSNLFSDNSFHVLALTIDNVPGNVTLWVDGNSIATVPIYSVYTPTSAIRIGTTSAGEGFGIFGDIGQVLIVKDKLDFINDINQFLINKWL